MKRARALAAALGGGLVFLAAGVRVDADGAELARLVILGAALGAVVATDLAATGSSFPWRLRAQACSPRKRRARSSCSAAWPSSR
jgi:hypothetical protein